MIADIFNNLTDAQALALSYCVALAFVESALWWLYR